MTKDKSWNYVPFQTRDESGKEKPLLIKYGLESMIEGYLEQAEEILKAKGFPTSFDALWDLRKEKMPQQIRDILDMMFFFRLVRKMVLNNGASEAALNMGFAIHAAARAQIRPAESLIEMGQGFSDTQKKKRENRQTWRGLKAEQIMERNKKIVEHFNKTHLTHTRFADKHCLKYGLKSRQVRDILKKALGS